MRRASKCGRDPSPVRCGSAYLYPPARNLDSKGILYSWPLIVCENIMCVLGTRESCLIEGTGLVIREGSGVSLMPRTRCAGASVECTSAPACMIEALGDKLGVMVMENTDITHANIFVHREDSAFTFLYEHAHLIMAH